MTPTVALLLWLVLIIGLLSLDPAKENRTPLALWVPLIWMFIIGSRLPSQWLNTNLASQVQAQTLQDGNPLDRTIDLTLIMLATGILIARSFNWKGFISRNFPLIALLLFALLSVVWSDFPLITFKRWFRDLGSYFMILVILSDPRPEQAARTVVRRLSYVLISLSILMIKYFPDLGKQYDPWTGAATFAGATTSKNMLGAVCLVSGLFFCWDTVTRWPERRKRRTKQILLVNAMFFGMILWLIGRSESTTSRVCLVIGCLVIFATQSKIFRRYPGLFKALIPLTFCTYLILDFGFNMNGRMAELLGKDPTLHDRTKIWALVLSLHTNPIVGTGYQSFWLGDRLSQIWAGGLGHINEAHNGYLEVYLEAGLIGDGLLVWFLIDSYRKISKRLGPSSHLAVFGLATWLVLVFYNMSEAAFGGGLLYTTFLIGSLAVPLPLKKTAKRSVAVRDNQPQVVELR